MLQTYLSSVLHSSFNKVRSTTDDSFFIKLSPEHTEKNTQIEILMKTICTNFSPPQNPSNLATVAFGGGNLHLPQESNPMFVLLVPSSKIQRKPTIISSSYKSRRYTFKLLLTFLLKFHLWYLKLICNILIS